MARGAGARDRGRSLPVLRLVVDPEAPEGGQPRVDVVVGVGAVAGAQALTADDAVAPQAGWAKGFKARVGAGTQGNQRVAPGTVAIPWHWGDRGLGVGSRANDLCIDSWDANTKIPEYKACLCKIQKVTP